MAPAQKKACHCHSVSDKHSISDLVGGCDSAIGAKGRYDDEDDESNDIHIMNNDTHNE